MHITVFLQRKTLQMSGEHHFSILLCHPNTQHLVVIEGCLSASMEGKLLVGTVTGTLQLWSIKGNATPSNVPPRVTLKAKMDLDFGRVTAASFNKNMELVWKLLLLFFKHDRVLCTVENSNTGTLTIVITNM